MMKIDVLIERLFELQAVGCEDAVLLDADDEEYEFTIEEGDEEVVIRAHHAS